MKLSAKGQAKLRKFGDKYFWAIETGDPVEDSKLAIEKFEFEPDDLDGAVVLTVEEAHYLKDILSKLFENISGGYVKPYPINPHTIKREIVDMEKRIKQAEGKCEKE